MKRGSFYTLIEPIGTYYNYEYGESYECVDGDNCVLRAADSSRGWENPSYGPGTYYYVSSEYFREVATIHIGGE